MLLFAILLLSSAAQADPAVAVGVGKGMLGEHGMPFERVLALGYEHHYSSGIFLRPEGGWFMDISGNGKSSFWVAPLFGIRAISPVGPEMHIAIGPGYLQNPDQVLGGHFQFSLEGGVGMADKNFYIGLCWKHLSSAGLEMPNQGRDFLMVQIRLLAF